MIITSVGSMGCGKSTALIHLYVYVYALIKDADVETYTSYYNKDKPNPTKKFRKDLNSAQIASRIHEGIEAVLLDDKIELIGNDKSNKIYLIDEIQFIGDIPLNRVLQSSSKNNVIYLYGLNTSFEDLIWEKTRKICQNSDFIYVLCKKNIETNYMNVDNKFDLNFRKNVKYEFNGCTNSFWYDESLRY
ncbi:hypothetical protein NGRA_3590, partial [Nosema granulosis]